MLENIIGQTKAKETVEVLIQSIRENGGPFPHTLLTGPGGIGKSSFARAIANELGTKFIEVNSACTGTASEVKIKLLVALEDMQENSVLFLDELHALNKNSQEILYTAVEDGYISYGDCFGGKIKVKPFTLLGATTDLAGITNPMQTRFKYQIRLNEYSNDEISQIISQEATKKNFTINPDLLSPYCRGNPRTAINYLDWIYRYCSTKGGTPTQSVVMEAMSKQDVYDYGLTKDDLRYIELLKSNKVMGVRSIAHTLNIPEKTVKEKMEPYLLKLRLINILPSLGNKRGINLRTVIDMGI